MKSQRRTYPPGIPGVHEGFFVNTQYCAKIIKETKGRRGDVLAMFITLSKLASDHKSRTFQAGKYELVGEAGMSERCVKKTLAELVRVGLVSVEPSPGGRLNQNITLLGEVRL